MMISLGSHWPRKSSASLPERKNTDKKGWVFVATFGIFLRVVSREKMQRKDENVLDKADELTSGWLIEVKARFTMFLRLITCWTKRSWIKRDERFIPGIARLCLMASTIEDSLRYWREYGMYINYFGNLWTKQEVHAFMEPDYFVAGCFLWPMILKIFPAILLVANVLSETMQKRLCYFFYFMGVYGMIGLQGK